MLSRQLLYGFISLLVWQLVPGLVSAQSYSGDSWSTVKQQGSGTLAVSYYEVPGIIYQEATGNMAGLCVDILDDFAVWLQQEHGVEVSIDYQGGANAFGAFMNNTLTGENVVGVSAVSITEERKKSMKFTPYYLQNMLVLVSNSSATVTSSWDNLETVLTGKTALVLKGSTNEGYMRHIKNMHYPDMNIEFRDSEKEIVEDLTTSPDYFSILEFTTFYHVVKERLPIKRHNVDLMEYFDEELGFLLSNDSDWGPIWNQFLNDSYRKSEDYAQSIITHLGAPFLKMASK
ncbi:MAG: transporter substrate-binding domain-containing protein [Bacteroidota bacterium]